MKRGYLYLVLAGVLLAPPVMAQSAAGLAGISGVVRDPSGAFVPSAEERRFGAAEPGPKLPYGTNPEVSTSRNPRHILHY